MLWPGASLPTAEGQLPVCYWQNMLGPHGPPGPPGVSVGWRGGTAASLRGRGGRKQGDSVHLGQSRGRQRAEDGEKEDVPPSLAPSGNPEQKEMLS